MNSDSIPGPTPHETRMSSVVRFAQPVPLEKGERPGDSRRCAVTRRTILDADESWPTEFRRGYRFHGSHTSANSVPFGGRVVILGRIVSRSRDGRRIVVAE